VSQLTNKQVISFFSTKNLASQHGAKQTKSSKKSQHVVYQ